jgi:glyceraldehyde-3-phosphate dehydrogenase [NAD(P)+]
VEHERPTADRNVRVHALGLFPLRAAAEPHRTPAGSVPRPPGNGKIRGAPRTNRGFVVPEQVSLSRPVFDHLRRDELFRDVVEWADGLPPRFRMYVGGRWTAGSVTAPVDTPIDGGEIARVPEATADEVADAIDAADRGRRTIRDLPGHKRAEIFEHASRLVEEHKEAFEEVLLFEAGKPPHDRHGEVTATAARLRAAHSEARNIYGEYLPGDWSYDTLGKMALVIREPLGIVGCIGPFNYPLFIPTAKLVPALLAGNSVVAKASHQTPLALLLLARVLEQAGLPGGTFNVVTGSGASAGQALVSDPRVRMVSFTGSTAVGKHIHATAGLKRFHLELGGKCHAIVLGDADVPSAATKCVEGAFKNAGQRCDAVSVAIVEQTVAEAFTNAAAEAARAWTLGDPRQGATKVGPLISDAASERVDALVRDAVGRGARALVGGRRRDRYFEPTVLADVAPTMRIAQEETFGPVLPIVIARDEEDALDIATRTRYGLDMCVFGRSFDRLWRAAKRLDCGEVTLNDLPRHGTGHFPFGGQRESGVGREGIGYSIDEMTELKTIVFTLGPRASR